MKSLQLVVTGIGLERPYHSNVHLSSTRVKFTRNFISLFYFSHTKNNGETGNPVTVNDFFLCGSSKESNMDRKIKINIPETPEGDHLPRT